MALTTPTGDELTIGRLVVHIDAAKRWCLTGEKPGATITVREAPC